MGPRLVALALLLVLAVGSAQDRVTARRVRGGNNAPNERRGNSPGDAAGSGTFARHLARRRWLLARGRASADDAPARGNNGLCRSRKHSLIRTTAVAFERQAVNLTTVTPVGVLSTWQNVQMHLFFVRPVAPGEQAGIIAKMNAFLSPPLNVDAVKNASLDPNVVNLPGYKGYPMSVTIQGTGSVPAGVPTGPLVGAISADPTFFQSTSQVPNLTVRQMAAQEYFFPSVNVLAIVLPIIFILLLAGAIVLIVWLCCYRKGAKGGGDKGAPAKAAAKTAPDPTPDPTPAETTAEKRSRELREKNERARLDRERLEANAATGPSSPPPVASALPPHLRKEKSPLSGVKPSDAGKTTRGADTSGGASSPGGSGYTMRFMHSAMALDEDDAYTQSAIDTPGGDPDDGAFPLMATPVVARKELPADTFSTPQPSRKMEARIARGSIPPTLITPMSPRDDESDELSDLTVEFVTSPIAMTSSAGVATDAAPPSPPPPPVGPVTATRVTESPNGKPVAVGVATLAAPLRPPPSLVTPPTGAYAAAANKPATPTGGLEEQSDSDDSDAKPRSVPASMPPAPTPVSMGRKDPFDMVATLDPFPKPPPADPTPPEAFPQPPDSVDGSVESDSDSGLSEPENVAVYPE